MEYGGLIKNFKMPNSTIGENPLVFAQPQPSGMGTITVICGPNGAGKSYTLKVLKEIISGKKVGKIHSKRGWEVEFVNETAAKPSIYRPEDHFSHMNSIGTLSKEKAKKVPKENDELLKLTISIFEDVLMAAEGLPESTATQVANLSKLGESKPSAKLDFLEEFIAEESRVYWLELESNGFLNLFSSLLNCRVGLTWDNGYFQLAFSFGDGTASLYSNLSDGQKSLFLLLASVHYSRPDVLIFDELENFLHPQMMTQVLEFLKRNVRQTIMTTHHPHIIFGRLIDQIFFLERTNLGDTKYPSVVKEFKQQPNPPRRISILSSENEKLAGLYRLFDVKDTALLAAARYIDRQAEVTVLNAAHSAFCCLPAPVNNKSIPDRQTLQVFEMLQDFYQEGSNVLDWGAGLGRVYQELQKLGAANQTRNSLWKMYDPFPTEELDQLVGRSSNINILSSLDQARSFNGGLILATNVLHILPHEGWVDFFDTCISAVKNNPDCRIVVSEIFPLLAPEQNALPLPNHILTTLFRSLGFEVYSKNLSIFEASAYCLVVRATQKNLIAIEDLPQKLREFYSILMGEYKSIYGAIPGAHSQSTRNEMLNAAFGLATASIRLENSTV